MQRRILRQELPQPLLMLAMLVALLGMMVVPAQAQTPPDADTYTNPLKPQVQVTPQIPNGGIVESCADPTIFRAPDTFWYIYCTKDPLNDQDRNAEGQFIFRNMPILKSADLVNWTYEGDVFTDANFPSWVEPTAGLFAPDIQFNNGTYYLYYTITDTKPEISGAPGCNGDSAIGVATSTSPTGPWVSVNTPVVEPRYNGAPRAFGERECNFFWTYDPEVNADESGQKYMFYGSYYGGIFARKLSADYLTTDPASAVQLTVGNRYEGPEIVEYEGYYYMFVSAANCCNTAITGYSVFAGRSTSLLGPYVDREGVSLLAGRVGGTPVLSMNGNRWVGPGHNSVFQDFEGQYWTVYHAVDRFDPNYEGALGFTKRPVLLDPIDWIGGWPTVRGGLWASDMPMPAPAAQPGDESGYMQKVVRPDVFGRLIPELSDDFNDATLKPQWSWIRQPGDAAKYGLANGSFRFDTQAGDLFQDSNNASVLTEAAPAGNYMVETKVTLNLPAEGCCFNYVQAGLVIHGTDDAFIKLVHASIWETRQTEFAKEVPTEVAAGGARYGNTVVGPPNLTTWLRIVKRVQLNGEETYTAYTSRDGRTYVRGGTWTHNLGANAKIGLVSMGGTGFTANFDYVRVYKVQDRIYMPSMMQQ